MCGQMIHLIYEDDAWLVLSSHLEQVLHQLLGLSQPLADEVTAAHREEGGVVRFGGDRLGKVGLAGAWRAKQQDSFPRFSVP